MFVFCMQHGMPWVDNPIMPEQHSGALRRSRQPPWLLAGLMAQAGHASPANSFVPGDLKTARMFGRNFAESMNRVMVTA